MSRRRSRRGAPESPSVSMAHRTEITSSSSGAKHLCRGHVTDGGFLRHGRPIPCRDGRDPVWRGDKDIPGPAASIRRGFIGPAQLTCELVTAEDLPDGLDRIELGSMGRQLGQRYVVRNGEISAPVPTRAVQDRHRVTAGRRRPLNLGPGDRSGPRHRPSASPDPPHPHSGQIAPSMEPETERASWMARGPIPWRAQRQASVPCGRPFQRLISFRRS